MSGSKTVPVTLLRNYAKPGKALRKGATIEVSTQEAERLKTLGIAKDATSEELGRATGKQQREAQAVAAPQSAQRPASNPPQPQKSE